MCYIDLLQARVPGTRLVALTGRGIASTSYPSTYAVTASFRSDNYSTVYLLLYYEYCLIRSTSTYYVVVYGTTGSTRNQ
jgi:hypothetical protein